MNNTGWICPKCGKVFSPYVTECSYCNNNFVYASSNISKEEVERWWHSPYDADIVDWSKYDVKFVDGKWVAYLKEDDNERLIDEP